MAQWNCFYDHKYLKLLVKLVYFKNFANNHIPKLTIMLKMIIVVMGK